MAHPRVGNGALNGVRFSDMCNIGIAHVSHRNVSLFTNHGRRFRINSHIVMMNPRRGMGHITRVVNGSMGHLSTPGVTAVFVNVVINVVFNSLPFTVPNVPIPLGLNVTNNPLVVTVLVNHFNCHVGLIACAAASTGVVLQRVKLMLFLTDIKVGTNTKF